MIGTGVNGAGKTALLRVISGIWPAANGRISLPAMPSTVFVVPQKPYMVSGSLREQITYPLTLSQVILEGYFLFRIREAMCVSYVTHVYLSPPPSRAGPGAPVTRRS